MEDVNQTSGPNTTTLKTAAQQAGIDVSQFEADELLKGLKVEQEHNGTMGSDVDIVPGNNLGTVLKIAIAHLREDPKYYSKLEKMEKSFGESYSKIEKLIADKKATVDDFNMFIESLPSSANERVHRHTRNTKQFHDKSPGKQVDDKTDKIGDNDPTRTLRGKMSVDRQAKYNKRHPEKFVEAIEFIMANKNKQITEETVAGVRDKDSLLRLILRLLAQSGVSIDRGWLHKVRKAIEGNVNR